MWYYIFNDECLNKLVKKATTNNFSIKQAVKKLQQSRLSLMKYSKEYSPMIDFNGGYDFYKLNNTLDDTYEKNYFNAGFDISWEIDIWGKGKYLSEEYIQIMKNANYSLQNVKVSITAELIKNYINLRLAEEKLSITNKNLKLQNQILNYVQNKFNTGLDDSLALYQAEFVTQNTNAEIPLLKYQIEMYKNSIAILVGGLPDKLDLNSSRNITAKTFKFDIKKLYNLPLDIIKTRPDIMATQSIVAKQNAVINQAITDLYPSISLSASFGFLSLSGRELFNNDSQVYGYNPTISIPIWQWGQLKNNIELQKNIKEEYVLNYNEALLTTLLEIKTNISSIENTYKENKYQNIALAKMFEILKLTQNKYDVGLIDFTNVAIAEQNYLEEQINLAESNANILLYITQFYKATGGGYNIK